MHRELRGSDHAKWSSHITGLKGTAVVGGVCGVIVFAYLVKLMCVFVYPSHVSCFTVFPTPCVPCPGSAGHFLMS